MLDAYELRYGSFEFVDSHMIEYRSKKILYYKLLRFLLVLLFITSISIILISFASANWLWSLLIFFTIGFSVVAVNNLQSLTKELTPQVSSIIFVFDKDKKLEAFKIRKWQQNKIDEYLEEDVRYNQAVGFRVIWFDDGFLNIEIIVDPEYPGSLIFETYDFHAIAQLKKLFSLVLPKLETWVFVLGDETNWPQSSIEELEEEYQVARIPWNFRDYFSGL